MRHPAGASQHDELLGNLPRRVRTTSFNGLQYASVAELLGRPSNVVLPGEEQVAGRNQVSFMVMPNLLANVNEFGRTTELRERFKKPVREIFLCRHVSQLPGAAPRASSPRAAS